MGSTVSSVTGALQYYWMLCNTIGCCAILLDAPFQVLLALGFICLLFDNSAAAYSKFTTLITCAANSVLEMKALLYCTYKSST
jgi:hypothetical protein